MMKSCLRLFLICISVAVTTSPVYAQKTIAFTRVNIVSVENGEIIAGQTVVISDGRIVAVGPTGGTATPQSATIIDGAGQYLMPGLAEMHGHIPGNNSSWPAEDVLFLYVSQGITTVRGMLGAEGQLELREKAAKGEIISPTLYLAAPALGGHNVESPEDARAKVKQYAQEGWDLLKVHEGLSAEAYDAIAEAANEVGLPFAGHVTDKVTLQHALDKGQRTIEHMDNYLAFIGAEETAVTIAQLQQAVDITLKAGAGIVPTLALFEHYETSPDVLASYGELRYAPQDVTDNWAKISKQEYEQNAENMQEIVLFLENQRKLLNALSKDGVEILLGSDAPQVYSVPGFSLHREMASMENAGMNRKDILYSGTGAAGAYFASDDTFSVIAPGARADLVLLSANPLDDLANTQLINGVMLNGRWITKSEIAERLEEIAERYLKDE